MMTLADAACTPILNGNFPGVFGILGGSWLNLTLLALLSSLLILIAVYLFASFLRNQQLLTWTKFELFQIFGTAVILIFSIVWLVGICTFKMDFLSNPASNIDYSGKTLYTIVDEYFGRLETIGLVLFGYMMYVAKIIAFLQKVTYFSNPLGLGMTDNPLDSLGQINSIIFFAVSGFITSYMLLGLQMRIMEYMAMAITYYMFPFGIFFRAFEPTRGFGGALIGISLAFLLFYPVAIVFNDYIMRSTANQAESELAGAMNRGKAAVENNILPNEKDMLENVGDFADPDKFGDMMAGVGSGTVFIIKPLAFYVIAAVILPVLNFIVLVEITKGLTKIMGEELDVSNLTRLI